MRTTIFVIALIAIICTAFYIRSGFDKNEEVKTAKNLNKKGTNPPTDRYIGGLLPVSKWSEAVIGEWNFYDKEENENWLRTLSGDIEFFPDGTFIIGYSLKKYDLTEMVFDNIEERKPKLTAGGNLKGNWEVIDSYIQLSGIKDCDYNLTYHNGIPPVNRQFDPCQYYEGFKIGSVKDKERTTVQLFNKHRILVEGKRYSTGAAISYELIRNQEKSLSQLQ